MYKASANTVHHCKVSVRNVQGATVGHGVLANNYSVYFGYLWALKKTAKQQSFMGKITVT